jgi:hypothetical protein
MMDFFEFALLCGALFTTYYLGRLDGRRAQVKDNAESDSLVQWLNEHAKDDDDEKGKL